MSRFHLPRKTVETIKCRSTTSRCLIKTAVSRVHSCGSREASTSRIADRARPKPGERNPSGLVPLRFSSSSARDEIPEEDTRVDASS